MPTPTPTPSATPNLVSLLIWDVTGTTGTSSGSIPTAYNAGISGSALVSNSGLTTGNAISPNNTWNRTYPNNYTNAIDSINNNQYIEWSTTVKAGYSARIIGFTGFNLAKYIGTSSTCSVELYYSTDGVNFAQTGSTFTATGTLSSAASNFSGDLNINPLIVSDATIIWRLVAFNNVDRLGIGNSGTNNIAIYGTIESINITPTPTPTNTATPSATNTVTPSATSTATPTTSSLGYYNGLCGTRYIGYFDDNPSWFSTATAHGDTNNLSTIDNFTSSIVTDQDYYSWEWFGYFKPSSTENYTFYTSSDDGSYLWIGENAISGYTTSNCLVNNGGAHGTQEAQGTTTNPLISGIYYPIRIQFGEIEGGDILTVSFSSNTVSKTTNGTGYFFNMNNCPGSTASKIFLGSTHIASIKLGSNNISKIYLGSDRIL